MSKNTKHKSKDKSFFKASQFWTWFCNLGFTFFYLFHFFERGLKRHLTLEKRVKERISSKNCICNNSQIFSLQVLMHLMFLFSISNAYSILSLQFFKYFLFFHPFNHSESSLLILRGNNEFSSNMLIEINVGKMSLHLQATQATMNA